jgi:hypothetical protein
MATRILGPTGSKRRRRFLLVPLFLVALAALLLVGAAQAVHDETFQLDGDVLASTTTNYGGHTQSFDWDSFFNASGNPIQASFPDPSVPDFTASGFHKDFNVAANGNYDTSDRTTYTSGSKDTLNISTGWVCTKANNVTDKGDIQNAYAVAYTDPVSGDSILYFGMERNSNNGDANVAFWFLQDATADCTAPDGPGSTPWSGNHQDGDVLVVSAFTKGGDVSTVNAYRWNGGAGGSLGTTPVASGGDCTATNPPAPLGDASCATANKANITTPWLTNNNGKTSGLGHTLLTGEFFEGGINLTDSGLAGKCFNTFVGDTRASQSLGSAIYDFARGSLGECRSTTVTTPVDATDNTQPPASTIPADPATARVDVKDKTVIDVIGVNSFSGSISWHICGPTAASSTQLCDGTAGNVGVDLGSQNITVDGTYYSPTATVTAAGRYCFRAEFSGDSSIGVPPSSDSRASECFVVAPVQPTLTTDATDGPVDFGQPISDTVTLSGTAHKPGTGGPTGSNGSINPTTFGGDATGNIIVKAFGPDSCSTLAFTSTAIAASGDGSYGGAGSAFAFTPTAPGQYIFVASYAGDSPNTLGIPESACSAAPDAEKVTVRQIPTEIKTKQSWIPNDTATVSATIGNLANGGSVHFQLFGNSTCSGAALYDETVSVPGGSPSAEVSTSNTGSGPNGFKVTSGYTDTAGSIAGPYSWKIVYTPAAADTAHTGKQSACDAEHFSVTYTNDPGPGTNLP